MNYLIALLIVCVGPSRAEKVVPPSQYVRREEATSFGGGDTPLEKLQGELDQLMSLEEADRGTPGGKESAHDASESYFERESQPEEAEITAETIPQPYGIREATPHESAPYFIPPAAVKKCNEVSEFKFTVILRTDNNPGEISWELRRSDKDVVVKNIPYPAAMYKYNYTTCLKRDGDYEWSIFDRSLNGIQSDRNAHGYFVILIDDEVFISGGNFNYAHMIFFTAPCPPGTAQFEYETNIASGGDDVRWSLESVSGVDPAVSYTGGPFSNGVKQSVTTCLSIEGCYNLTSVQSNSTYGSYGVSFGGTPLKHSSFNQGTNEVLLIGNC